MRAEELRRLADAIEQARARAAEALVELEGEGDAPRAVTSAIQEAEEALTRLAHTIESDA